MDTTTYLGVRDKITTGDLLSISGSDPVSWIIRAWTRSAWSHVGLLVRLSEAGTERVFLLHATAKTGVVLLPVSRYLAGLRGTASWVRCIPSIAASLNAHYRTDLLAYALQQLGRGYDFRGIARFVLPCVPAAQERFFCSELAASAYRAAGVLTQTFQSPALLVREPIFEPPVSLA